MEDNNFKPIIIFAIVIIVSIVKALLKSRKKDDNVNKPHYQNDDFPVLDSEPQSEREDISPIINFFEDISSKKKAQMPIAQSVKSPINEFEEKIQTLPTEGERATNKINDNNYSPIYDNATNKQEKKDKLRKAIIYGEILAPKF